jgi:hypothetical protein
MHAIRLLILLLAVTGGGCQTTRPDCSTHPTVNGDLTECN